MREYLSFEEASKFIAGEVAQFGQSKGWTGNPDIAQEVEKHLSKFNIGYTDPTTGTWTFKHRGTRYFASIKYMNLAKSKVGNLISSFRK